MKTITIRGDEWETDYLLSMLQGIKPGTFQKQRWAPGDALVMKDGSRATIFNGQTYDPEKMTLRRSFWDHDHCVTCNWLLINSQGEEHAVGYFNGYNWLCEECHRLFIIEDQLKLNK
jgi:hypothetical protein